MKQEIVFNLVSECSESGARLYQAKSFFGTFDIVCDADGQGAEAQVPFLKELIGFPWLDDGMEVCKQVYKAMIAAYILGQKSVNGSLPTCR